MEMLYAFFGWIGGIITTKVVDMYFKPKTDLMTDKKRKTVENVAWLEKFETCREIMPKLFEEMYYDLKREPNVREVIFVPRGEIGGWGGGYFMYKHQDHDDLDVKFKLLLQNELLTIIDLDKYKAYMTEKFVSQLKSLTIEDIPYSLLKASN